MTSVTSEDITWTFDGDYTVGQFVNGDWYVVAPSGLSITEISPGWDGAKGGSMLNVTLSTAKQGFDSRVTQYGAASNVGISLPIALSPNDSLLTSIGNASQVSRMWIKDVEVLTVLASAPAANSFRPPYAGSDKAIRGTLADMDMSWLQSLAPGANGYSPKTSGIGELLIDMYAGWPTSDIKTSDADASYGRDLAHNGALALLWLHTSTPTAQQKQDLLVAMVQRGIDTYGLAASGSWKANGGHMMGRKLYAAVAAKALDDDAIYDEVSNPYNWHEDQAHFYVPPQRADVPASWNSGLSCLITDPRVPGFTSDQIGMPEWTSNWGDPVNYPPTFGEWYRASPVWSRVTKPIQTSCGSQNADINAYRIHNGVTGVETVLAMELSGLEEAWDWPAYFDYINDRYWPAEAENRKGTSSINIHLFAYDLWNLYKGTPPIAGSGKVATPAPSVAGGIYDSAQSVSLSSANADAIHYTTDGSTPTTGSAVYSGAINISETTTLKALGVGAGLTDSAILSVDYAIACATPTFSPESGSFEGAISVTLSTTTSGAAIHYTTDGSTPTTGSATYSAPIAIESTQTIRAIAVKAGLADSFVSEAAYVIGTPSSEAHSFTNVPISERTAAFTYKFNAIPSSLGIDAVIGFSNGANLKTPGVDADAFHPLACIARFFTNDKIEVRDGGVYVELLSPYVAGTTYSFRFDIDVSNRTYSVSVTPEGGETVEQTGLDFRSEQAAATALNNIAMTNAEDQELVGGDYVSCSGLSFRIPIQRPRSTGKRGFLAIA